MNIEHMEERRTAKQGDKAIPGSYLGPSSSFSSGEGTQVRRGSIYSTLTGRVELRDAAGSNLSVVSIVSADRRVRVPQKGDIVLCRVVSVSNRQAKVVLLTVNDTSLREKLHGVIRREDIRDTEKDSVEMFPSFRPRDIVRARVIGLGENYGYALSTAENELGVVFATSEHNGKMLPVSWCEMQCSVTGTRERRKVAKVVNAVPIS